MPEWQRYITRVETRVVVSSRLLSGGELPVGEYTVRAEAESDNGRIPAMVEQAMARVSKQAKVMAAGVDNTERNRRK